MVCSSTDLNSTCRYGFCWRRSAVVGGQELARHRDESRLTVRHDKSVGICCAGTFGSAWSCKNPNISKGKLKPIYEVFPIAKMPEAIAKLQSGKVAGRLVVDFNA
jgi:hypothetical protein